MPNEIYKMDFAEINNRFTNFPYCKVYPDNSFEWFEAECLSPYKVEDISPANGWVFIAQGVFLPGITYALWKKNDLLGKEKTRLHMFFDNGQNILLK